MLFPSPKNEEALYPGWCRPFSQPCGVVYTALQCSGWFFPILGDCITDALMGLGCLLTHKGLHVSRLFHVPFLPFTYSVFPGPAALFPSLSAFLNSVRLPSSCHALFPFPGLP